MPPKKQRSTDGIHRAQDLPEVYPELLTELKSQIISARLNAALSVNRELILLYWKIGRQILSRQEQEDWGSKVIDRLANDLRYAFPEMKGFSPRNLKYMRALAEAYANEKFAQAALAQISRFPGPHHYSVLPNGLHIGSSINLALR